MPDDNLPPLNSDIPPSGGDPSPTPVAPMGEAQSLALAPEQIAALGLDTVMPGTVYNIQLKSTGAAGDDPGAPQNFEVVSATPDTEGADLDDGPPALPGEPGDSGDLSNDQGGPLPPPGQGMPPSDEPDDSVLGFKRKIKPPRMGLPATAKMRDL